MRKLISVPNTDAPDANYPKGRVRDKDGGTPGTTYVEALHGDMIQFFQKLVVDSGVVENGNPDNETNGHQLIEALGFKVKEQVGVWTHIDLFNHPSVFVKQNDSTFGLGTDTNLFGAVGAGSYLDYIVNGKNVHIIFKLIDPTTTRYDEFPAGSIVVSGLPFTFYETYNQTGAVEAICSSQSGAVQGAQSLRTVPNVNKFAIGVNTPGGSGAAMNRTYVMATPPSKNYEVEPDETSNFRWNISGSATFRLK